MAQHIDFGMLENDAQVVNSNQIITIIMTVTSLWNKICTSAIFN